MTSLLAGTVAHGARGGRGVSTSHYRRCVSPGLSGTPRHSPELPGNGSHNTIIIANEAYHLLICNYSISLMSSLYYTTGKLPWEDTGSIYI